MNIMFGFRTLDPDPAQAQALVDGVRITPLDGRDAPATRIVSPDGRPWDGDQPRGLQYWVRLHDIYQREIVDERDRFFLAMLRGLGIEKGKPFAPADRLAEILTAAAAAGELMAQANTFAKRFPEARWWPDREWFLAIDLDRSDQRGPYYDQLLERASWFYEAVSFSAAMKSQTPGLGQAYLGGYTDADGQWLDGARSYTIHVPAEPPAKLFWSFSVYDVHTRCLIDNEQQRGDRGSRDPEVIANSDGSVDLYFAPLAPAGGSRTGSRPSPGGIGSPTSAFTDPWSRISTAPGNLATSRQHEASSSGLGRRPRDGDFEHRHEPSIGRCRVGRLAGSRGER